MNSLIRHKGCIWALLAAVCISTLLCFASVRWAYADDGVQLAGNILTYALPAIIAGLTLSHRDSKGALEFGESAALTLGVTYALKYSIKEERPIGGPHSFPSAHSSFAFSSAEFLRKRYGWEYGVPAYAVASFIAYSRVECRAHHPHDVIVGAAIGIISSYIFAKPYKGWQIEADTDSKYWGLRLTHSW